MTSSLPESVRQLVAEAAGPIRSVTPVGGGDVSHAARVETDAGPVFVKWGAADYAAEAEGLAALAEVAGPDLAVPAPLAMGASGMVLPWIESGRLGDEGWRRFGAALAEMHRQPAPGDGYGWTSDNWVGSKPQRNGWNPSWPAFFGEKRLLAQAETVRQRGAWDAAWDAPLARLVARLGDLLPARPPCSLLHGDLWSGNALGTADGRAALIDPAVYVGHREADLAMTELFGGFPAPFYEGYHDAWPLEPGYPERREVYNLYHLTNHLTHGPGYRQPVMDTLRRFSV